MNTASCRKSVSTLELGWCKRAIVGPILAVLLVVWNVGDATAQRNAEVPNANAAASNRAVEQLSKKLYESLIREARALQQARQSGYRAEVWDRLKQAKQLPNADAQELKAVAASCMGDYLGNVPETALQAKVLGRWLYAWSGCLQRTEIPSRQS